MRNISEEIKNSIVNVFPKDKTIAVIIFGSYGTNRQTCHSDIDIAWIPKKKVPITQLAVKSEDLRKVLDVDVDLKIVTDNYSVNMKKSILEGDAIYESKDFRDYVNDFYFEHSDLIDILNWREINGS